MTMSSVGRPRFRPASSFPDLMQMASSPTSNLQLCTMTRRQESRSRPSPFCEYQGLSTVMLRITMSSQSSGWMFHAGEFWNVGPSSSTRRHSTSEIITGRRNSRAAA